MNHFLKFFATLLVILFMQPCLFSQGKNVNDTIPKQIRKSTLKEAFSIDSVHRSPLLKAYDGIGIGSVKEAYRLNRMAVDSLLQADSLNPNLWRVYGYQAINVFSQANKSPQMAMSLLLPPFLILFLILILPFIVKTMLFRPKLEDAIKPGNDQIAFSGEKENIGNDIDDEQS